MYISNKGVIVRTSAFFFLTILTSKYLNILKVFKIFVNNKYYYQIIFIFKLLWPAIRDTFKEKLEDDFTPDIARAWTHVFDYLKARFQEGIRRGRNQKNEV